MEKIKYKDLKKDELYFLKYIDDPRLKNTSIIFTITHFNFDNKVAYFKCISIFNDLETLTFKYNTEYLLREDCYEFIKDTAGVYKLTDNEEETMEKNN